MGLKVIALKVFVAKLLGLRIDFGWSDKGSVEACLLLLLSQSDNGCGRVGSSVRQVD